MAILVNFNFQSLDTNGNPNSAGTLTFYESGTTTPQTVYSDEALTTAVANPYTLDAAGRVTTVLYCTDGAAYTILEKTSAGATVTSRDGVWGTIKDTYVNESGRVYATKSVANGGVGLSTSNTAAANTAAWNAFIVLNNDPVYVEFPGGIFPFQAPFYIRQQMTLEGKGFRHTTIDLEGADEHGAECVYVNDSLQITRDTLMENNCVYTFVKGMAFDCRDMTMSTNTNRFIFYAVTLASSLIERCWFRSSTTTQMDACFHGPSRADAGAAIDYHHVGLRSTFRDNRMTNYRDGLVIGRSDDTWTENEPASGGAGDFIGGDAYENQYYDNTLIASGDPGELARHSIKVPYYDHTAGTVSQARGKPYACSISGNSIEHGGETTSMSGTITLTNGSTAVTGSGTAFDTDLPAITAQVPISIRVSDGSTFYSVKLASITDSTNMVLGENWPGTTVAGATYTARAGAGIYIDCSGDNIWVKENYIDDGYYGIWNGSNSERVIIEDNRTAGNPYVAIQDDSAYDSDCQVSGLGSGTFDHELTISGGVITLPVHPHHGFQAFDIDTESDAASDDLDTINGAHSGVLYSFSAANAARSVVFKDGTGNLRTVGDVTLNNSQDVILMAVDRDGENLKQQAEFANNGA